MGKRSVLVVSLLSLFLLFSFRGYALLTIDYPWKSPDPATYNPVATYRFNVTVCDDNSTISTVLFEWNGEPNSTVTENVPQSSTCFNFTTTKNDLPANETGWSYKWFANNIANENALLSDTYTINKANPSLYLLMDGNNSNVTVDRNWTINFTAYSDNHVTVFLNTSLSGWELQNNTSAVYNTTKLIQADGVYNITAYTVDNGNYSANSVTSYLNISEIAPTYSEILTSDSTYSPSKSYQFNITWQDGSLGNVTFNIYNTSSLSGNPINLTFNSVLNSTNLVNYTIGNNKKTFSVNVSDLPAGSYSYVWTALDTLNQNNSITSNYNVAKSDISSNLILTINPSSLPAGGGSTTVTCSATGYPVDLILTFLNFGSWPGGNSISQTATLTQSTSILCQASGDNYTGSTSGGITVATSNTNSPSPSGPSTPTGSFLIKDLASSLAILQGESKSAQFTLSNTLSNNIANVSVSVSGIDSSWYTLSKSSISILAHGSTQAMTITFNIPNDAEAKNYDVTISAKGKALSETTSRIATKTMTLTVNSSQPQPIQPMPSVTVSPQETVQENETANITSNQTSVVTGLAPAFEFFKNNLVIILAVAACLLIFIFRNNITTALGGTLGNEEAEKTHKAKSTSPLKGIKDKLNYKLIVNLKKESKAKSLKEPTEVQDTEKVPEAISEKVPEKETKRPAILEKEIKRDIKELQSIIENEKKVGKNKKKFSLGNN